MFLVAEQTRAQSVETATPSAEVEVQVIPEQIQRRIALIESQFKDMDWD